jgi:hypothetical protein
MFWPAEVKNNFHSFFDNNLHDFFNIGIQHGTFLQGLEVSFLLDVFMWYFRYMDPAPINPNPALLTVSLCPPQIIPAWMWDILY